MNAIIYQRCGNSRFKSSTRSFGAGTSESSPRDKSFQTDTYQETEAILAFKMFSKFLSVKSVMSGGMTQATSRSAALF